MLSPQYSLKNNIIIVKSISACGGNKFGKNCEFGCSKSNPVPSACSVPLFCLPDPYGCTCNAGFFTLNCGVCKYRRKIVKSIILNHSLYELQSAVTSMRSCGCLCAYQYTLIGVSYIYYIVPYHDFVLLCFNI